MKPSKKASPLGSASNPLRIARLVDQPFRLDAVDETDVERAVLREAIYRGADELQLLKLLSQLRYQQQASRRDQLGIASHQKSYLLRGLELQAPSGDFELRLSILPEIESYRRNIKEEFAGLPAFVQSSFGDKKKGETPEAHYLEMRHLYYVAGYDDPAAAIFQQIKPAKLLGHTVGGGVHQQFIKRLGRLEGLLNSWTPGLAAKTAAEIKSVYGFVPRYIAGSTVLSNHAYGLAIDIDANWNPHIKHPDVIEVLNWVVRDFGFNFGKRYVEPSTAVGDIDRVAQIHTLASQASDVLKKWLQQHLPAYKALQENLANAKKKLHAAKRGSQAHKEAEEAVSEASKELNHASGADQNIWRLQIINQHHTLAQMEEWSKHGIQTVPLYLVVAMKTLGFRWGQEYEGSKDAMHFELLAQNEIPRDSEPRGGVKDLGTFFGTTKPAKTRKRR